MTNTTPPSTVPIMGLGQDNDVCHSPVCDDRCRFPSCMGPAPTEKEIMTNTLIIHTGEKPKGVPVTICGVYQGKETGKKMSMIAVDTLKNQMTLPNRPTPMHIHTTSADFMVGLRLAIKQAPDEWKAYGRVSIIHRAEDGGRHQIKMDRDGNYVGRLPDGFFDNITNHLMKLL